MGEDVAYDKDGKKIPSAASDEKTKQDIQKKEAMLQTGFVAQDVERAAKQLDYDFSGVDKPENESSPYGLRYAEFVVPLVKAVQELSKMNDDKDTKIENLQKQIDELKALMTKSVMSVRTPLESDQLSVSSTKLSGSQVSSASLGQNMPNPFNHTTTINYSLPQQFANAQIIITDQMGKTIKAVNISGSGKGSLSVDASAMVSGNYNYSLYVTGKFIDAKQMILAK